MGIEKPDFFEDEEEQNKDKKEEQKEGKKEEKLMDEMTEKEINRKTKQKVRDWIPFLNEDSNKIKIEDPDNTIREKLKITKDAVNWRGLDSLPWFDTPDFKIVQLWDRLRCTFKTEKWDVNISISNFAEKKEDWEDDGWLSINIIWDIKNLEPFPDWIFNPTNPEDAAKLIDLIDQKVQKRKQDTHNQLNIQKKQAELKKEEEKVKNQDNINATFIMLKIRENEPVEKFLKFVVEWEWFLWDDWGMRKTVLALWTLMRHYSTNQIEDMLKNPYDDDYQENIQRNAAQKSILSGEPIIEYLSNHMDLIWDERLVWVAQKHLDPNDYSDEDSEYYIITQLFLQSK